MEVITIDDSSSSDDEDIVQLQQTTAAAVVVGANSKQRPLVTPKFDDHSNSSSSSSSISSDDSIWNKGLSSSSLASRAKPRTAKSSAAVVAAATNNTSANNSDENNDRCYITKSIEQLSLHEHNTSTILATNTDGNINSDADSSISSNDSIWDKVGLSTKTKKADIEEVDSIVGSKDGSIDIVVDCCSSSIESLNDSILNDSIPSGGQLKSSIKNNIPSNTKQTQQDDSSISSNDSIWDKQGGGFTSRKKKERVESYYDYYRLKHNNNNNKSVGNDNTTSTTTVERQQQLGSKEADADNNKNNNKSSNTAKKVQKKLPHHLPSNATWHIVLLMDHREFGCANDFLQTVEKKINKHFGGDKPSAEITTLASADYLFVARLISNDTKKKVLDERVLDMVIERKNVADACSCLIAQSKKYKPLSFFEAQMYKLQTCGISKKIFLMEGDEDKTKSLLTGAKTQNEKERRLKRVKSLRLQLANDEFDGVTLVCTRNRYDTVKFLIHQLETFRNEFDHQNPPTKTRDELKNYINDQMSSPTFVEYLRLRSIPGIGDVKAMKVIMDPNLDWDKSFMSPSSSKESKSTLEDKATFWKATSASTNVELGLQYEKVTKTKSKKKTTSKKKSVLSEVTTTAKINKENGQLSANVSKKTTKVQTSLQFVKTKAKDDSDSKANTTEVQTSDILELSSDDE